MYFSGQSLNHMPLNGEKENVHSIFTIYSEEMTSFIIRYKSSSMDTTYPYCNNSGIIMHHLVMADILQVGILFSPNTTADLYCALKCLCIMFLCEEYRRPLYIMSIHITLVFGLFIAVLKCVSLVIGIPRTMIVV
jgi:hypothetical protein